MSNENQFQTNYVESDETEQTHTLSFKKKMKTRTKVLIATLAVMLTVAGTTSYINIKHMIDTPSKMTVVYPGMQFNTLDASITTMTSDSLKIYRSTGKLYMTTVSILEEPSEWDVFIARRNPEATVVEPEALEQTVYDVPTEVIDYNQNEMSVSLSFALASAFDYLKIPYNSSLDLADVTLRMQDGSTIKESTVTLLQIGKEKITNFKQVENYMFKIKDSSPVYLKIKLTNGKEYDMTVKPTFSKTLKRYALGFYALPRFKFPVNYNFNAEQVSGGSGGLILALAAVEELTPEQIIPNMNIGGTGAISSSGEVEEIAGLKQKLITGHKNGNNFFFIPKSMCSAVDLEYKTMKVIPVATLEDAINQLKLISLNKPTASCK